MPGRLEPASEAEPTELARNDCAETSLARTARPLERDPSHRSDERLDIL
jgi:hypothetical protein